MTDIMTRLFPWISVPPEDEQNKDEPVPQTLPHKRELDDIRNELKRLDVRIMLLEHKVDIIDRVP